MVHLFLLGAAVFNAIPAITLVGAWYVMFRSLDLYNTYAAVILAHATLNPADSIWLMATFIREVPRELEEAARIDGCGTLALLWRDHRAGGDASSRRPRSWCSSIAGTSSSSPLNLTAKQTVTVPVAIARTRRNTRPGTARWWPVRCLTPPALILVLRAAAHRARLTAGAVVGAVAVRGGEQPRTPRCFAFCAARRNSSLANRLREWATTGGVRPG
ncbi:MAG: carbohydrate ABC transporter permease [Betaproteobacteria bacterium]|nr:carbohydrate ABC transporter permease [Betaproteobacteria bacterium]